MSRTNDADHETPVEKLRHVVMYLTEAQRLATDALRELEEQSEEDGDDGLAP